MPTLAAGSPEFCLPSSGTTGAQRFAPSAPRVTRTALCFTQHAWRIRPPGRASGFTLLELLVVLAIIALASAGVGFALRDDTVTRLERDALRLGALLEAARAQSQVTGVALRWRVMDQGFRFEPELPATPDQPAPRQWLDADTRAELVRLPGAAQSSPTPPGDDSLLLGPDAIIAPQAVVLYAASQPQRRVRLATDGVRPFAVQADAP